MKKLTITTALAFLAAILAANYVTTEYGMIPVSPWHVATAGTYLAGLTFILRDAVQDSLRVKPVEFTGAMTMDYLLNPSRVRAGNRRAILGTMVLIVVGAGLSYLVSDPFIALASGVAFLASEVADLLVYTPLRKRGYIRAAVASNIVGSVVDTFLFLWIAGFPILAAWEGQMVGKLAVTLVVVLAVAGLRARRVVTA